MPEVDVCGPDRELLPFVLPWKRGGILNRGRVMRKQRKELWAPRLETQQPVSAPVSS